MVYFVQGEITRLIKIGCTDRNDIKQRFSAMQTGSPDKLIILKTIRGSYDLESALHRKFSHLRAFNEWFRPEKELLDFLKLSEDSKELTELREKVELLRLKQFDRSIRWRENEPKDKGGTQIWLS